MARVLSIDAIGAVIDIDGSDLTDDAWAATRVAWQDAVVASPPGAAPAATVKAHATVTAEAMLSGLSVDVTHAALAHRAGDLLMLHAAGLATQQGGVVALVGPSGRGKTTASRVLGRGLAYISDESIGIAADGAVLPYRKPLSLIERVSDHKVQRSPSELGLLPLPHAPLHLAGLVLLQRSDDAIAPRMELVSLAEGMVELAQQASYLGRLPSPLRTLASHIEAVGGVKRITYGNAEDLAPLIRELGANAPVAYGSQADAAAHGEPLSTTPQPSTSPGYRRVPVLDALPLDDGQIVLLVRDDVFFESRAVVLDGIAPTIWRTASRPTSLAALVEAVVAVHGEPIDQSAASLVAASVVQLTEAEVLTCD